MIAADVEVVFVGTAIPDHAGFEVVAAWWSEGCVGRRVGWSRRGDGEGEGQVDEGDKGRECEVHCECF